MDPPQGVVERRMLGIGLDRLTDEPVILLAGPRAVGKSTALRALAEHLRGAAGVVRYGLVAGPSASVSSAGLIGPASTEHLERGYDHGLYVRFTDAAARDAYLPHRSHRPLADLITTYTDTFLVFDLRADGDVTT